MPMVVVFVAPNYTENAVSFLTRLTQLSGITPGLISQEPQEWLPEAVRKGLAAHWRVDSVFDSAQLLTAAQGLAQRLGPIDRLFAAVEQVQVQVAEVREQLSIPGMRAATMRNFRDKAHMKNLLRAAGLPCAHHRLISNREAAHAFAAEVGFPLIVKPSDGAGSQATYKVDTAAELGAALDQLAPQPGKEVLLEEFITGDEFSFDTFSLEGRPVFHSLTHYYPNPLDVMRHPWIQWQVLLPREIDDPRYDDIRQAAFRTLEALGMETGMTHLEWFRRRDGSIAISEVAARPPGAQITTLLSRANDFDAITAWLRLMIFHTFTAPERRYAVGAAYLRGQGQGHVSSVEGMETIQQELGDLITDLKIPRIGQPKSLSYEGEGYIILRHPETAVVKEALQQIVSTVRVHLG